MTLTAVFTPPTALIPLLDALYGSPEGAMADLAGALAGTWVVRDEAGEVLGALGLRPPTRAGTELVGGALPGDRQVEAAQVLLQVAREHAPVYAYAEAERFPAGALAAAGFSEAGAYLRLTGPVPDDAPAVPPGFRLVPLSEVESQGDRWTAQESYTDQLGHTPTTEEAIQPDVGGSVDVLGRLAYGPDGRPAGVCRVWLNGEEASLGTPGVRADVRGRGLRAALLRTVCQAARAAGATRLVLQSWGDAPEDVRADLSLGLMVAERTAIYLSSGRP